MAREIELEEICKPLIETALLKQCWIASEQIDAALVASVLRYDLAIAIWPDASKPTSVGGSLELVRKIPDQVKGDFGRANSFPCIDENTALKLQALCDEVRRNAAAGLKNWQ